jgi:hypothetical protein
MKFKTLSGKGVEFNIGLSVMYYLIACGDNSFLLSNDKKSILNQTWEEVQKIFSNGGKLIAYFKKLREAIEKE